MDLKNFKYNYNLVSTLTVGNMYDLCKLNHEGKIIDVNYDNSISFYNLVESFNKLYISFKKDYENLAKLNLGKSISFCEYFSSDSFKHLQFIVDEPLKEVHDGTWINLAMKENNKNLSSCIMNNKPPFSKERFIKYISLDKDLIKDYLDLSEKYKLLLDAYNFLKSQFIFGNGTMTLSSQIKGDIFNDLEEFILSFGALSLDSEDFLDVPFKLGEESEILYNDSKVIIDSNHILDNQEVIDDLIHNLYINRSKLPEMFSIENEKQLKKTLY